MLFLIKERNWDCSGGKQSFTRRRDNMQNGNDIVKTKDNRWTKTIMEWHQRDMKRNRGEPGL